MFLNILAFKFTYYKKYLKFFYILIPPYASLHFLFLRLLASLITNPLPKKD